MSLSAFKDPATYHILSYGTLLGSTIFQSFIGGITAYRALPRAQFSSLQKAIFPPYFVLQTAAPTLLFLTYPRSLLSPASIDKSNTYLIGTMFVSGLLNLVYVGPETTRVMGLRKHQETRDGKKSWEEGQHSEEMQKLNKQFGILHGYSTVDEVSRVATMQLLDLPPEIFQNIAHSLVVAAGLQEAWKLRQVCRVFAGDIRHDILQNQPLYQWPQLRLSDQMLGTLVVNRMQKPLNTNAKFLNKMRQMVDYLKASLSLQTAEETTKYATMMSAGVLKLLGPTHSTAAICGTNMVHESSQEASLYHLGDKLTTAEKLGAATAVGAHSLVRLLLGQFAKEAVYSIPRCLLSPPLQLAIARQDKAMVSVYIEWIASMTNRSYRRLLFFGYGFRVEEDVAEPMETALDHPQLDIVKMLAAHYPNFMDFFVTKAIYNLWMARSFQIADESYLEVLLSITILGKLRVTKEALIPFGRYAGVQHARLLLDTDKLDVNRPYPGTSPLIAAIRGGNIALVECLLNAGADMEAEVDIMGQKSGPLLIAVRSDISLKRKLTIAQLLLDRGAMIPDPGKLKRSAEQGPVRRLFEQERLKRLREGHII
ncbi:hypothetical protein ACEQ8H_005230 [Pleosporales sp. CAS-2024a]